MWLSRSIEARPLCGLAFFLGAGKGFRTLRVRLPCVLAKGRKSASIVLRDERHGCRLALLDPALFEQRARDKQRSESTVNHGTVI